MNPLIGPCRSLPRGALAWLATGSKQIRSPRFASTSSAGVGGLASSHSGQDAASSGPAKSPLAVLPLSALIRSYAITSMSSSPFLLQSSMNILKALLHSRNPITSVDRNPLLNWLLKRSFYDQFCAGENKEEVQRYLRGLEAIGYDGTILEYALEVLEESDGSASPDANKVQQDIDTWRKGLLETVDMVNPGDFVGLKWSGMGAEALHIMKNSQDPTPQMAKAMSDVCEAAVAKKVLLLPAAEPQNANATVDAWNIKFSQRYNRGGDAVVYNTYQTYLKSTPSTLARHLAHAQENNYTLGVKLVRGAYLETEPRHLIWDTKEQTDKTYDALASALLQRRYNSDLQPVSEKDKAFPKVTQGQELVKLAYAQLQGMADEVSCELVQGAEQAKSTKHEKKVDVPRAFKCVTWGTTSQCLNFLLRRAAENKDSMSRTHETRKAMGQELWRRLTFQAA